MGLRRTFLTSIFILIILTLLSLHPLPFFNGATIAGPGTSNPSTSTITVTTGKTNTSSVTLTPGAGFKLSDADHTASYDVITDNFNGYKVSLFAADNAGTLVNESDSTYTIPSITSTTPPDTFPDNKWAIKPNVYYRTTGGTTTNTNILFPDPGTAGLTLDVTNVANPSTANTYTIALGAKVDGTIPSGTYTRTNTITVTPNEIFYTINYDKNTTDTVTNLPTAQSSSTSQTKITLDTTTPSRTNYNFTGWCQGTTTTTNYTDTCSGTTYQPGDDFGIDQTTENITTLYAMWERSTVTVELTAGTGISTVEITGSGVKTGGTAGATSTATVYAGGDIEITATPAIGYIFNNWTDATTTYTNNPQAITNVTSALSLTANATQVTAIQNFSASECTSTPKTVVDIRDNQSYTIQRLADGKCWMMDNLNLGAVTLTTDLDSTNTNIAVPVSASAFNSWKKTSGTQSYTNGEFISLSGKDNVADAPYGTLYNYCAITGGDVRACVSSLTSQLEPSYDICPAGWRLPTGGTSGEFANLYAQSAYNSYAKLHASIANGGAAFALAGYFDAGTPYPAGSTWDYWSSTRNTNTGMYDFNYHSSAVTAAYTAERTRGVAARCILDENIHNMQNISQSDLDALVPSAGNSTTLKDTRDGQKYTVTKLSDGNIWMTQNLRFTGTTLTPADSNVSSNITMNYGSLTDAATADSTTDAKIKNSNDVNTGVWYNYVAATAGTITGSSNSHNATQDICPAGWRLPTSTEISGITADTTNFAPVYGGHYRTGQIYNSNRGNTWSSDAYSDENRYYLTYYSGALSVQNNTSRIDGFFIRCIYDKSVDMQNINYDDLNNMIPAAGNSTTLRDSRDRELYTVTKLGDGNFWMTQNLRFTGTELTPADTNVDAATTINWNNDITTDCANARYYNSDNSDKGVYYNYAGTTANEITSCTSTTDATQDICPAGWRLPTRAESDAITGYASTFNIVTGRYHTSQYQSAPAYQSDIGTWWSSAANTSYTNSRYALDYRSGTFQVGSTGYYLYSGFSIRCIHSGPTATMQDFSSADATAMSTGATKTLIDSRDNQKYLVAKLADGNVWMIDNLNLGAVTFTTNLTSANTNINGTLAANTFLGYKKSSGSNTYTAGEFIPVSGTDSTSNSKYGTLYNHCAVSAGTVCTALNVDNTTQDICPKGWRLPTGGPTGEYHTLYNNYYNSYQNMLKPVNEGGAGFSQPGYFNTGAPGGDTAYQTSTRQSDTYMYALSFNSGVVHEDNYGTRGLGFAVRCIKKDNRTISNLTYMQDITPDIVSNTPVNTRATLTDKRDNKQYLVGKLADGEVWMLDNLALDPTAVTLANLKAGTNATDQAVTYLKNGGGTGPYATAAVSSAWQTSYVAPFVSTAYINTVSTVNEGAGSGKVGVYYNFCAASSGAYCYPESTSVQSDITQDICPKSWRLPVLNTAANTTNEMTKLVAAYGGDMVAARTAFSIALTGAYAGTVELMNERVLFWSSSVGSYNQTTFRNLIDAVTQGDRLVLGTGTWSRYYGYSIRCLAK